MQEENQYDAVIIGGGPAGAATAAILGEYGHNVIVLEREKFPRYHIGESLLPFTYHPLERVKAGQFPVFRALTPTDEERLIREFVLQMKLGKVSADYFNKKFNTDVLKRFAAPLQTLKDWGFLKVDGDAIILNREGLLQVDRLLHEFFLPQHKNARYA